MSDPGYVIVQACIEAGITVEALPGPTSILPAMIMSGFDPARFYFYGFMDKKETHKKKEILSLAGLGVPVVLFESPNRVKDTLLLINETLGETQCAVVKEISKIHEKVFRGTALEIANIIPEDVLKGEFIIVFLPAKIEKKLPAEDEIKTMLVSLVESGVSLSDAVKQVSTETGMAKNAVYKIGNEIKRV
jgi:16S rRNA (cytidine1402-2'-O)-methyltransferase